MVAQCGAARVVDRDNQRLDDGHVNVIEVAEKSSWARHQNGLAGIKAQTARAEIAGRRTADKRRKLAGQRVPPEYLSGVVVPKSAPAGRTRVA